MIAILRLKQWGKPTMWLHFALALTVTTQLALSLVMHTPKPGQIPGFAQTLFTVHRWVGMLAFIVVLVHWFFAYFAYQGKIWRHLFPFSKQGLQAVWMEMKNLMYRQLPPTGPHTGLPGLIHGLGFLAVTAMAFSGAMMFIFYPASGWLGNALDMSYEFHKFMATLVWIYWLGHVFMAFAHQWSESKRGSSSL